MSALTVVFVNSKSLSSIKIDDTPVDDPSLKVLVANNSDTLKLLKMSSCPHVSPAGYYYYNFFFQFFYEREVCLIMDEQVITMGWSSVSFSRHLVCGRPVPWTQGAGVELPSPQRRASTCLVH